MQYEEIRCRVCGSERLEKQNDGTYVCKHCRSRFCENDLEEYKKTIRSELRGVVTEALVCQRAQDVANIRRNLFEALQEEYTDSYKIIGYCRDLKRLLPNDFQANCFEALNNGGKKEVNAMLESVDEKGAGRFYVKDILEFMVKSLMPANLLPLKSLAERALKDKEKTEYLNKIEEEAGKCEAGLYSPEVPRKAFIAYSSKDMAIVTPLVEYLENAGISCFVALRNMRHGRKAVDNYDKILQRAMHNCKSFVLISTRNSRQFDCDAIEKELPYVRDNEPNVKRIEYLVEDYRENEGAIKSTLKDFFGGSEWVRNPEDLALRIMDIKPQAVAAPAVAAPTVKYCLTCGAENPMNVNFCGQCGKREFGTKDEYEKRQKELERLEAEQKKAAASAVKYCLFCGEENPVNVNFCGQCGKRDFGTKEEYEKRQQELKNLNAEQMEAARREAERKEAERKEAARKEAERRETEKRRLSAEEWYQKGKEFYDQEKYDDAYSWLLKAAEQGNAAAQNNLGFCYDHGRGVEQNYTEAVKWYRKAAEQGNAAAQFNLGVCYASGRGVERNYTEAVKWYRKAAEQGNNGAQKLLGFCYANGLGVEQSYTEAVKWYRKAAEQSDPNAQLNLGDCYYYGQGVEQSYTEAVKWYRAVAELGLSSAQFNLGVCYESGQGVGQSYTEAVKWYQKAAEQGYAAAQNNLGDCYYNGRGVEQSYTEAVKWYQKAAEQGYAAAQNNLGDCYYNGRGVEQSYTEAVKWFHKAAEQGNANAQFNLGDCYYYSRGVERSYTEAVKWYRKAAERGEAKAQNDLAYCYEKGLGVDRNYGMMLSWLTKAARQGYAVAQSNLGECYFLGKGVNKDFAEAVHWFQEAAQQENADAQYYLGECYYHGLGVKKDKRQGIRWYQNAARQGHADAIKWLKRKRVL